MNKLKVDFIILTHGHGDHIGGVEAYRNKFNAPVYAHKDEKEMLTLWLADKFIDAVEDEQDRDLCNDAIIVAQEKIKTM